MQISPFSRAGTVFFPHGMVWPSFVPIGRGRRGDRSGNNQSTLSVQCDCLIQEPDLSLRSPYRYLKIVRE